MSFQDPNIHQYSLQILCSSIILILISLWILFQSDEDDDKENEEDEDAPLKKSTRVAAAAALSRLPRGQTLTEEVHKTFAAVIKEAVVIKGVFWIYYSCVCFIPKNRGKKSSIEYVALSHSRLWFVAHISIRGVFLFFLLSPCKTKSLLFSREKKIGATPVRSFLPLPPLVRSRTK